MSHTHDYKPLRDLARHTGPPVDYRLLSRYIGALYDRCRACRIAALRAISEDPVTAGGFVAMVAAGARKEVGPHALEALRGGHTGGAGGAAAAAMLADNATVQYEPTFAASRAMSPDQRRAAVHFATGAFVALLAMALSSKPVPRTPPTAMDTSSSPTTPGA